MKLFLEPILAKKGPSGDEIYFKNLEQQDLQHIYTKYIIIMFSLIILPGRQMFNNFIGDLRAICSVPDSEAYVKTMLIGLCTATGLHDLEHGLIAQYVL